MNISNEEKLSTAGTVTPSRSASSASVDGRMPPSRWRCRWPLGSARTSRMGGVMLHGRTIDAMKLCYALRRGVFYPSTRDAFGEMPPTAELRRNYLPLVKRRGFDGVEVP